MDIVFALVRHGEYQQPANVPSAHLLYPLTETGREQARSEAKQLEKFCQQNELHIHPVIESSVLLRAFETAAIFAKELSNGAQAIEVNQTEALMERSTGAANNLTVQEIEKIVEDDPRYDSLPDQWKGNADFRLPVPGAESIMDAGRRVKKHVDETITNFRQKGGKTNLKILIGHGASLRAFCVLTGIIEKDQLRALSTFHCRPIYIRYNPQTGFRHMAGEFKIRKPKEKVMD